MCLYGCVCVRDRERERECVRERERERERESACERAGLCIIEFRMKIRFRVTRPLTIITLVTATSELALVVSKD